MAIKQIQPSKNEKRPLGRLQETKKQTQEYFDLHSCVELLDVKSIIPNSQAYIQLVDYGYLQLMEIPGKDLGSMSYNEVMRTIENFETWLTRFGSNIQVETTTLPTNTDTQISDLRHHLDLVREEMSKLSIMIDVFYNSRIVKFGFKAKLKLKKAFDKKSIIQSSYCGYLHLQQPNWTNWFVRLKPMEIMILFHKISATGRKFRL